MCIIILGFLCSYPLQYIPYHIPQYLYPIQILCHDVIIYIFAVTSSTRHASTSSASKQDFSSTKVSNPSQLSSARRSFSSHKILSDRKNCQEEIKPPAKKYTHKSNYIKYSPIMLYYLRRVFFLFRSCDNGRRLCQWSALSSGLL